MDRVQVPEEEVFGLKAGMFLEFDTTEEATAFYRVFYNKESGLMEIPAGLEKFAARIISVHDASNSYD